MADEVLVRNVSTESLPQPERGFAATGLQLAIAAGGLLLYLATLNHWLTLNNLLLASDIGGWRWQPMQQQPALFLLTWPLRLLPAAWIPPGLNVFAAVCASVTLGLLARSVVLLLQANLPAQESSPVQQRRPSSRSAWVPAVLGAVALGLQLTFWENATTAPGEMLDLLLFAVVVWCLLEYRMDPRLGWLDGASFIGGLALANNWAIAGYLPLIAVALIWSRRLRFFNVRFLQHIDTSDWRKALPALGSDCRFFVRMALFGLGGLSLILLLPLLIGLSPDSPLSFWQALRGVLGSYKAVWLLLAKVFRYHKDVSLMLVAVAFFPVLILSVGWKVFSANERGRWLDPVPLLFYAAHAFLLVLCVTIAFDPPFSPRQLSPKLGTSLPFLPLYYLNALSLGYYSGFFLLMFSGKLRRHRLFLKALNWAVPKLAYALLTLMLAGLLWKNLPIIRMANGRQLEQYARFVVDSLPPEGAVVFSSDPTRLTLLQAALDNPAKAGRYVAVDANALPQKRYRAWLKRRYPKQWTEPVSSPSTAAAVPPRLPADAPLDIIGVFRLMDALAQSNRLCALEVNYGLVAEYMAFQPSGLAYELRNYPTNSFSGPPLTGAELDANKAFWKQVIETGIEPLEALRRGAEHPAKSLGTRLMKLAHITQPPPEIIGGLAHWYSGALNGWGVLLQRYGEPQAATTNFVKALELNPDNVTARVNLECNTNLLADKVLKVDPPEAIKELIERYRRNWAQVLIADGPPDAPTYCYWLGMACLQQDPPLRRQAGQLFERAQALAPREIKPRLVLGDLLSEVGMPDRALELAAQIEAALKREPYGTNLNVEVAFLKAKAWLVKTNQAKATEVLRLLLDSNPGDAALLERIKTGFAAIGSYTNALGVVDRQLRSDPDNIGLLQDKGLLCLTSGDFSNAIPAFTRVLSLTNNYATLMYLAQAYLQTAQFDAAVTNYHEALRAFPASADACYGLMRVYLRKQDTNTANQWFQQGVSNALHVFDQQLEKTPNNVQTLMDKGVLLSRAGKFSNAIPVFTRVLSLTNNYGGRLFRALGYLETDQLDAAEADCQELLRRFPEAYQPYFGLGDIAVRRGNTNAAIQHYQQFLSKAPPNQPEFQQAEERLKSLQPSAP